jgi:hypothetical protein
MHKLTTKVFKKEAAKRIIAIKRVTKLQWTDLAEIEANEEVRAKALYLYWACFRGHNELICHILDNDKISPFVRIHEGRSPLMASLFGKANEGSVSYINSNSAHSFRSLELNHND